MNRIATSVPQDPSKTLETVAERSNSELILFFVIVAVVILIVALPMYRMAWRREKENQRNILERRQQDRNSELEEKRLMIKVVQENTAAITKLAAVIDTDHKNCEECKDEQVGLYKETLAEVRELKQSVTEIGHGLDDLATEVHHMREEMKGVGSHETGRAISPI